MKLFKSIFNRAKKNKYSYRKNFSARLIRGKIEQLKSRPLISIVMPVFNVNPYFLKQAIKSIQKQIYTNWELCIADDGSTDIELVRYLKNIKHKQIKITYLNENSGISNATNAAIENATGDYIAFMDHDDKLTQDALFENVKVINATQADFIYSDEDRINRKGKYTSPHYKPDFSPELLYSHNYITHFVCVKKSLLNQVGLLASAYDGAQDYDLILRITEQAQSIQHIAKVLYHWRISPSSYSYNESLSKQNAIDSGKKALSRALERNKIEANVMNTQRAFFYRVKHNIINTPLVSIIIPFCDKPELLDLCVRSIINKTSYKNYEILLVSNNSKYVTTQAVINSLTKKHQNIRSIKYDIPFNYSKINNFAVPQAHGEYLILLNNDTEIITSDWIESMLEHAQRKEIGCVGAKLIYQNETIQHAGVILGIGGVAGHSHRFVKEDSAGYYGRLMATQNYSAVTAACLMIKKSIYEEVGGLNEEELPVAFNDVDFCLRVGELGYRNVWTPYALLYHYESVSRGSDDTVSKKERSQKEVSYMRSRWEQKISRDPFYNKNLSQTQENFSLHQ